MRNVADMRQEGRAGKDERSSAFWAPVPHAGWHLPARGPTTWPEIREWVHTTVPKI